MLSRVFIFTNDMTCFNVIFILLFYYNTYLVQQYAVTLMYSFPATSNNYYAKTKSQFFPVLNSSMTIK